MAEIDLGLDDWEAPLKDHLSPEARSFIRAILGTYGYELAEAYQRWNEPSNSWRTFYRDIYYDQINNTVLVRVRIQKFNDDEFVIEGSPSSILELCAAFLRTVHMVAVPGEMSRSSVERFLEGAVGVAKRLELTDPLVELLNQPEEEEAEAA